MSNGTNGSGFEVVRISLASPHDIKSWSKGEVKKPETINYRTFRPEKDGLFCERIFGPTKDYECQCGKYKKSKFAGWQCEKCGVEVTKSKVRRRRMGHIELASPVAHIWYVKNTPSPIALLLDMSPRVIEKVIYFASYIVTSIDNKAIQQSYKAIEQAGEEEIKEIEEQMREKTRSLKTEQIKLQSKVKKGEITEEERASQARDLERQIKAEEDDAKEQVKERREALELLGGTQKNEGLQKKQILSDTEYRSLQALMETAQRKLGRRFEDLFHIGMGADAIRKLLEEIDLERLARELRKSIAETTGAKRARSIKRLEVVEAFRKSKNRPEWMILDALPVLPPDLRPMVQLEGGRFATSDLNDLYRRIINRNNRLKKITEMRAPESIINHEKRLLQEAVDALIDNSRKQRPVLGPNGSPFKSLSDMLKGKEGRFRRNLLGKRVDYSGRSVIVIGPHLKLNQCGIPRKMAKHLFRPFIMRWLEENAPDVHNVRGAKRMLEEERNPFVWEALEAVTKDHPVLLNRAPTLHRLGIQAFQPVLIDGKAIQIHPLVCPPFNADFDGDQMAVHVPLSVAAQAESRLLMMAGNNIFSPANGQPLMSPAYDIVLGCHYLTQLHRLPDEVEAKPEKLPSIYESPYELLKYTRNGWVDLDETVKVRHDGHSIQATVRKVLLSYLGKQGKAFLDAEKAVFCCEHGDLDLHEDIMVRWKGNWILTTPGRVIFNQILPEALPYINEPIDKGKIRDLVIKIYNDCGNEKLVEFLDAVKELGFHKGTLSGISLCLTDLRVQTLRDKIIAWTDEKVNGNPNAKDEPQRFRYWCKAAGVDPQQATAEHRRQYERELQFIRQGGIIAAYERGEMSAFDRDERIAREWLKATTLVSADIMESIDRFNPLYMMTDSGARGRKEQIVQMAGMRGLMSTALGTVIHDLPVTSNFHDGLPLLEYFVCTFSARRSLADTALRTADAGYLTRRLVDVAQDVIIKARDCGTNDGFVMNPIYEENELLVPISERIWGRVAAEPILHPKSKRVIVDRNEIITKETANKIEETGITDVRVRSPLTCELPHGICAMCYGTDLSTGELVEVGEAVGIIAAQSIGEPGTQFTMRTFHTVIGKSIVEIKQYKGRREAALREIAQRAAEELDLPAMIKMIKQPPKGPREEDQKEQRMKWWVRLHVPQRRGLLRVEELFDVRRPLGQSIIAEYDGTVKEIIKKGVWRIVLEAEVPIEEIERHKGEPIARSVPSPRNKRELAANGELLSQELVDKFKRAGVRIVPIQKTYVVPFHADFLVKPGQKVLAGDSLTEGAINPHSLLALKGVYDVQNYLLREIQLVYRSHGLDINDKHIEIIIRQMLRKRKIKDPGDTDFLPGQLVDRAIFQHENERVRKQGGKEALAEWVLMGIMRSAESTNSWLSAASFQRTTQALTDAAIKGKADSLIGLKENVIIGRLVPAGTGFIPHRFSQVIAEPPILVSGRSEQEPFGAPAPTTFDEPYPNERSSPEFDTQD